MMHESMQNPSSIAREAKGLAQGLRESLKKHEPWDREIEFQRANLRRQYLQLIFVHPYAKESKDADHSLWMTTSYFNITAYKQRIAAADAVTHQSGNDTNTSGRHHHGKSSGVVEHRKLVHRFRQFLAEEEKFWTSFIVRVVRVFDLNDARAVLAALGIPVSDLPGVEGSSDQSDRRSVFPAEDVTSSPSAVQKEQKLVMLSKALVCLGDIARYREHYNESGGRPRAGKDFHEDVKSTARGRGGRRGVVEQPPRPRNYSKAQECYERARLLVPDVGNACHQLAILASYQQDPFASVLQYYRAMCVKHPYDTAPANLDNTLSRNLEGYRMTLAKMDTGNEMSPKLRVERFKKSLVALHGLWRLDPADADTLLPGHAASVMTNFSSLVSERVLPTDIIWKTLVLALGALWRFRILRDPNSKRNTKHGTAVVEAHILTHVLGILGILMQVGSVQLKDASNAPEPAVNNASAGNEDSQVDLAQNITAVFRRTLPALRIGSKWVRVHFGYLQDATSRLAEASITIPTVMEEFWNSYAIFSSFLSKIFPADKLPKMSVPLEEDVDVSGFAPLKRAMFDPNVNSPDGLATGQSQVHPNEEQLMRIADLLEDARTISGFEDSPIKVVNNGFILHDAEGRSLDVNVAPDIVPTPPIAPAVPTSRAFPHHTTNAQRSESNEVIGDASDVRSDADDDSATLSTRTEDDPVDLAMQAQLVSDEDDDMDEQILYPKQSVALVAPVSTSHSFTTPSMHAKPLSPPKPVTAEDLVNEMMRPRGQSSTDPVLPRPQPVGTQLPPLLFGSGSPNVPTSIWSTTTRDPTSLSANNLRLSGYPGAQVRGTPPAAQTLGLRQDQAVPSPLTPTRSVPRQLSQPLQSPTYPGPWTNQGSSPLALSQSQSQQRHTLSPPSGPYVPQPPAIGTRSFYQAPSSQYTQIPPLQRQGFVNAPHSQFSHENVPSHTLFPNQQPLPSHNTWSFSGTESLSGLGAPLGPFGVPLPYTQSRLQHQTQASRSGAWAPS